MERPLHAVARVQMAREVAGPRELPLAERADGGLLLGELVELALHGVLRVAPGTEEVLDEAQLARVDAHAAGVVPDVAAVALDEVALREGRLEAAAVQPAGGVLLDAREEIRHDGLHVLLDLLLLFEDDLLHAREETAEHQLHVVEDRGGGGGGERRHGVARKERHEGKRAARVGRKALAAQKRRAGRRAERVDAAEGGHGGKAGRGGQRGKAAQRLDGSEATR